MNMLLLGLMTGFVTGLDNFIVSAGLGTTRLARRQIAALVAAFAVAEAVMPLVGFALARFVAPELFEGLGPVLLIVAGCVAGAGALRGVPRLSPWVLFTLPVLMSLDNLAVGAGLGALGGYTLGAALVAGAVAAIISTAGLLFGGLVSGRILRIGSPGVAQAIVAVCLIAVGVVELAGGA